MSNIELSLFCQLDGARISLRTPTLNDVDTIVKYYKKNEAHLAPFEPIDYHNLYMPSFWEKKIKSMIRELRNKTSLRLFIYENIHPDIVIGAIYFENFLYFPYYRCDLEYSIAKNKQGHGYMTEALNLAIDYVFKELHIHKIMSEYRPVNNKSNNLMKRLKFHVEGYSSESIMINNCWQDRIIVSLINTEWKEP